MTTSTSDLALPTGVTFSRTTPRLAFRDSGPQGAPAVVLLHGTSANLGVWDPVVDALAGEVRTVALDQRGHGRSAAPDEGYGTDDYVDDVERLRIELRLGPVVLVGHSLGARNAWVHAARHPDAVLGVLALDYAPDVEPEVLDALEVRVAAGGRSFADEADVRAYLRQRYPLMPEDAVARRIRYGYAPVSGGGLGPLAGPAALAATVTGLREDRSAEFAAVRSPLVMLRGAQSALVSPAAWQRAQQRRTGDLWLEVPGADHYVAEEAPEAVVAGIRALLATCS